MDLTDSSCELNYIQIERIPLRHNPWNPNRITSRQPQSVKSAISVVLFPTLKKQSKDEVKDNYSFMNGSLLIIVFFMLLLYYPLIHIVKWFLPNYIGSLTIFRVIFPGVAISSSITIIMYNVYKKIEKTRLYFFITLTILLLSFGANLIAYFVFKTPISISIASIIVIAVWYFVTEVFIIKDFKIRVKTVVFYYLYIAICMSAFYLSTMIDNTFVSLAIYLCSWAVGTLIVQNKNFFKLLTVFKNIFKRKKR